MPELPEVETVVRGLRAAVIGDTIDSVWIGPRHQPLKSPAAEIVSTLERATIASVRRMGKHIVIDLEREQTSNQMTRSPVVQMDHFIVDLVGYAAAAHIGQTPPSWRRRPLCRPDRGLSPGGAGRTG